MNDIVKHTPVAINGGGRQSEAMQLGELTIRVPTRDVAPVYNTIRVIDLDRLRSTHKRRRKQKMANPDAPSSLDNVVAIIDVLTSLHSTELPTVVVVERSNENEIKTNYAVVGDIIFLSERLSKSWIEGAESDLAVETLLGALTTYIAQRQTKYKHTFI